MHRFLQIAFWLALATTLYVCLKKVDIVVPASDKKQHALAFGTLTLLALTAYPGARLWAAAIALCGFGALIELIQPRFGRRAELHDWVADTSGIAIGLLLVWVAREFWFRRKA